MTLSRRPHPGYSRSSGSGRLNRGNFRRASLEATRPCMTTRWLPSEGGLVASWQRKFQVRRGSVPQRGCRSGYSESPYRLNRYVASCAKWTEAELLERNRLLCQRIARIWPLPWPAEQSGESVAERNANPAPPFKGGWMDLVPLEYCDRTVAGRTMLGFQYKGTSYPTGYWTTMFTKLFKLILEERRADTVAAVGRNVCQNVLALKHKKGLKLLVKKQSIWYMTNAPIPEKLAALRSLFKALGIPLEEVGIYLKPMADRPAAAVQYPKVPLSERSGPASLLVRDAVRLIRNGRCGQAAVSRPEGSVPDDAAPPCPMTSIVSDAPDPRKTSASMSAGFSCSAMETPARDAPREGNAHCRTHGLEHPL